jgi:hypothetical protein
VVAANEVPGGSSAGFYWRTLATPGGVTTGNKNVDKIYDLVPQILMLRSGAKSAEGGVDVSRGHASAGDGVNLPNLEPPAGRANLLAGEPRINEMAPEAMTKAMPHVIYLGMEMLQALSVRLRAGRNVRRINGQFGSTWSRPFTRLTQATS